MTHLSVIDALLQARRSATPADAQPLAASLSGPDQAYAVQMAVMAQLTGQPGVPQHWKSGGPSRDLPLTHAQLPPDGVWTSPATAGDWTFHQRGIEIEIALRLGVAVDAAQAASLQPDAVDHLIDAMAVSIEIVDSRWQQASAAAQLSEKLAPSGSGIWFGEGEPDGELAFAFTQQAMGDNRCAC